MPAPLNSFVHIVDDDVDVRDSLQWLLQSVDLQSLCYENAQVFLDTCPQDACGCILMDLRMPGISGLVAQKQLAAHHINMPLIMISAHGNIDIAVQALQQGAITFLEKPFDDQKLIDYINLALQSDQEQKIQAQALKSLKECYQSLTKREKQVFGHITQGYSNQETADLLGVNRKTVEGHRANLIQKMQAESLAQLVQYALQLGVV